MGIEVGGPENELEDLRSDIEWLLERRVYWGAIERDRYDFLVKRESELLEQLLK